MQQFKSSAAEALPVAQTLLRHKTQKTSFQLVFWISVALNCGALGWLFSSPGAAAFRSILRVA